MVIAVSACLLGENCKYSGGSNRCQAVLDYVAGHEVIPVCPEVAGGLPVPRPPAELVNGVVMNCEGRSVDRELRLGAQRCWEQLAGKNVALAILQPRSPSCGCRQVYDGTFTGTLVEGEGVFARLLREKGVRVIGTDEL